MPILAVEAIDSRNYDSDSEGPRLERKFWIHGTDDPTTAELYLPQKGEFWTDKNIEVTRIRVGVARVGSYSYGGVTYDGMCAATVIYERSSRDGATNPPVDENEIELNMLAQTEHIEKAKAQTHYPSTIDTGLVIGVQKDEVKGVDVYVPKTELSIVRERTTFNQRYIDLINELRTTINEEPFYNFAAGEVLFLGAVARRKGREKWRVQYQFLVSKNEEISVTTVYGGQTFSRLGWDYVWFTYVREANDDGDEVKQEIEAAHVAAVYDFGNFAALGIGTSA